MKNMQIKENCIKEAPQTVYSRDQAVTVLSGVRVGAVVKQIFHSARGTADYLLPLSPR